MNRAAIAGAVVVAIVAVLYVWLFESVDPERTRVRTRIELPVHGVFGLLAPLIRMGLKRDLATALEEDRRDLEERGYPRNA